MKPFIEQVQHHEVRDEVVDLLWEHRHWPGETRDDYIELWKWRYRALADGPPLSWVIRDPSKGTLVAHVAVFPRRFRSGTIRLHGVVPGDLLIHRDWRQQMFAPRLIQKAIDLVEDGQYDFVLTFATEVAHRIVKLRGFKELGVFRHHVDLRRSAPALRARSKALAILAPAVDAGLAVRRRTSGWRHHRVIGDRFDVEPLGREALVKLDRDHWQGPAEGIVGNDSVEFIVRRFFENTPASVTLFALTDRSTSRIEGYGVVGQTNGRATVLDCQTNAAALDITAAVGLIGTMLPPETETYVVPTLRGTHLANELPERGFFPRPSAHTPFRVAAYWHPEHELAERFGQIENWTIMPASGEF